MAHHVCRSTPVARVLARAFGAFARERRGQVSLVFALSAVAIMTAVGSGFDLSRAYTVRQSLSAAAALTCQYADRPSVVMQTFGPTPASYVASVQSYLAGALAAQKLTVAQTTPTPFTFTPGGAGDVRLSATVPTTLMNVAGVTSLPVSASAHCFDVPASAPTPTPSAGNTMLVSEGFELTACGGTCITYYLPNGKLLNWGSGTVSPVGTPPGNAGYVGSAGAQWVVTGYCIESDSAFISTPGVPEGSAHGELDCDNGAGTAGNSAISTRIYLQAGQQYEVRYFYKSRAADDNYAPAYICGSAASDTSWANDNKYYMNYNFGANYTYANSSKHFGARTDQINAYLDPATASGTFPTHTTLDGTQTLGGSTLIDTCLYAADWIERSIKVTVATAGYYWLSFAADGPSDSFGGLLDDIRMCAGTCPGSVQDNFPSDWVAANHGGVSRTLFEDTFESPVYNRDGCCYNYPIQSTAFPYVIYGTTGTSAGGWPGQAALGWATVPNDQTTMMLTAAAQGTQSMVLARGSNHTVSRPFLLVPGYYMLKYSYVSDSIFSGTSGLTLCGLATVQGYASFMNGTQAATWRPTNDNLGLTANNTNLVGVFMSHAQLASTPIATYNNFVSTTFLNPDGTVTATPAVSPSGINLVSYNPAQVNPLLDICGYATSWQARTVYFRIVKPAYYWLTFAALGTASGGGGDIDDVKVTALGGPYMSGPPAGAVTIPVPDPQPLATVSAGGNFSFVAESLYK